MISQASPDLEQAPSAPPSRMRYAVLLVLCSLAFLTYLDRICIMQVQGDIEKDLGFAELTAEDEDAALIYAQTGTMEFGGALRPRPGGGDAVLLLGAAMAVVGIGFKLAVAPFHLWTPDVYQGAPPPTAAFVAAVSKGAMLAVLLRFSTATGRSSGVFG